MRMLMVRIVVLAGGIAGLSAGLARGQQAKPAPAPVWMEELDRAWPEVPQAVWEGYVSDLQKAEIHAFAQAYRIDALQKEIPAWEKRLGVRVTLRERPFLEILRRRTIPIGESGWVLRSGRFEPEGK